MTTHYAHNNGYTYDDSPVLKNLASHQTQEDLDKFERVPVAIRMMEAPPDGDFDSPTSSASATAPAVISCFCWLRRL